MSKPVFTQLAPIQLPLVNKFYRGQNAKMRARRDEQLWVARCDGAITAALRVRPCRGRAMAVGGAHVTAESAVAECEGHWLLGVYTAVQDREQGIASGLITTALAAVHGPVWLFCHPNLGPFYSRLGFVPASELPEALATRLGRYRQSQQLEPWVRYGAD